MGTKSNRRHHIVEFTLNLRKKRKRSGNKEKDRERSIVFSLASLRFTVR
jgi:hypothetical protein